MTWPLLLTPGRRRLASAVFALALPCLCFLFLDGRFAQVSKNGYSNEVAMNGLYSFGSAFLNNELPYDKFYASIEPEAAFKTVRAALAGPGVEFTGAGLDITRRIKRRGPSASIIKRPDNGGVFSWDSVMAERGYQNKFICGRHGYFDNMNAFFSKNGFDIVDRVDFTKDEITFANIWGVCDGGLLSKTIKEADKNHA